MARQARPREKRRRRDRHGGGRRFVAPSIAGLALFGVFAGLAGWAWLSFDRDAYEAAMAPPVAVVDMPPAPESPRTEAGFEDEDGTENPPDGERAAAEPGERVADAPGPEERAPGGFGPAEARQEPAVPAPPPLSPLEEGALAEASVPRSDSIVDKPEDLSPVTALDGRKAWQVHARPFEAADSGIPKIALVIAGLGLSQAATEAAIQQLPGAVTLAFASYAHNLEDWAARARAAGHEVLLELPMEPLNYPEVDPGPHTLLTTLDPDENLTRLDWLLGRFTGYVGVTNFIGARFTTSPNAMKPILAELDERGLLYLDGNALGNGVASDLARELELPSIARDSFLDEQASRAAIDARLFELERIARSAGTAVGVGFPYPVTIERVSAWAKSLGKKRYALAPLSVMVTEASRE